MAPPPPLHPTPPHPTPFLRVRTFSTQQLNNGREWERFQKIRDLPPAAPAVPPGRCASRGSHTVLSGSWGHCFLSLMSSYINYKFRLQSCDSRDMYTQRLGLIHPSSRSPSKSPTVLPSERAVGSPISSQIGSKPTNTPQRDSAALIPNTIMTLTFSFIFSPGSDLSDSAHFQTPRHIPQA